MCSRSCLLPCVEYERLLTAVLPVFPYFRRHQCLSTECIRRKKTRLDISDKTRTQKKRQETYGQIKAYKSHFSYRLFGLCIRVCVLSYIAVSCLVIPCVVLCYVVLCCVVLCCVVLLLLLSWIVAVLSCAVLGYVSLCCLVLYWSIQWLVCKMSCLAGGGRETTKRNTT